jgi:hypothetical protein
VPDPATFARIDHPTQGIGQVRGQRDRIGQLHPAHLVGNGSDRQ